MNASTPIFKLDFLSIACKYINASYCETCISFSFFGFEATSCHSKIFLGAILLYLISIYVLKLNPEEGLAYFFIFLSAISFPHVLFMHVFYQKN